MGKLQILTRDMAETWNDYIQRFFAVIQQQRCCSNPWSNAKNVQFYHQKENDMLKLGCQDMPTWLYTRWEFHSDMQKFNARHNPSRSFENMVMSYYQETKSECRIESFHTSGNKKNWLFQCRLILRLLQHCVWSTGMLLSFLPSQETRPSFSEKDIERGKNERDGWLETWVESRKRLQNQRDVGMWVVAKLQNERKK